MAYLEDRFKTAQEILELPTEMLAGFLLEHLETVSKSDPRNSGRAFELCTTARGIAEHYSKDGFGRVTDLRRAIAEVWSWLIVEGQLAVDPEHSHGNWCFVTRRGIECSTHEGLAEFRKRRLFSPGLLNKKIRGDGFTIVGIETTTCFLSITKDSLHCLEPIPVVNAPTCEVLDKEPSQNLRVFWRA